MQGSSGGILREVRKWIHDSCNGSSSDQELLEHFCQHQDEASFSELVRRHAALVLGVCRRVLKQTQDAEDAFQATFLLLAQKARSVRKQESVGSWLHGVSQRVASNAKVAVERRRRREKNVARSDNLEPADDVTWRELKVVLDEELMRLPGRYRAVVLPCCLEGKSQEETARELGYTLNTVRCRLYRGRQLLKRRLTRRGISLAAGLLASIVSQPSTSAATALLRRTTVNGVVRYIAGKTGTMSAEVVSLAREGVPLIATVKARTGIAALLALTMIAAGAGLFAHQPVQSKDDDKKPAAQSADSGKPVPEEKQSARMDCFGDPLPTEAVARLGTLRFRHGGAVRCIAYSADGKLLASAGNDHTIRIWEAKTGKDLCTCIAEPTFHGISSVAFSPDGKTLASGDDVIRLWDPTTGKELQQLKTPHVNYQVVFSPDGNTLASVGQTGDNKSIWLWDRQSGKDRTIEQPSRPCWVAFSPDSKQLASACWRAKTVCLWDVATGQQVSQFQDDKYEPFRIVFSPDGKALVTGGRNGPICWCDIATGKVVKTFEGHKEDVSSLALSSDGRTLFSASVRERAIRVWDVEAAKELRRLDSSTRWEWGVGCMALSPDGKVMASCAYSDYAADNTVHFSDVKTGKEISPAAGHEMSVIAVRLSPDGKTATSVSIDGTCRTWDAATGDQSTRFDLIDHDRAICWQASLSADAKLAAVLESNSFRLWDVAAGKELGLPKAGAQLYGAPQLSPRGDLLALTLKGGGGLYDVKTGQEVRNLQGLPSLVSAFSADGSQLAIGQDMNLDILNIGRNGGAEVQVFDVASGKEIRRFQTSGREFLGLAFSPDGRTLATLHLEYPKRDRQGKQVQNQVLTLWELASKQSRAPLLQEQIPEPMAGREQWRGSVAFSPDGRTMASSGVNNVVHVWEVATGKERHHLEGHHGPVTALSFSSDGTRLVSGAVDTSILIWDMTRLGTENSRASVPLSEKELKELWTELAGGDAAQAYQALGKLLGSPKESLTFVKEHLHSPPKPDLKGVPRLLADLDSEEFSVRKEAIEQLQKLGDAVEPALRKALEAQPSLETQKQLEELLEKLADMTPERMQVLRALEVVERLDTAESRQLLEKLADGPADDYLTKEAKAIVKRLAAKHKN